MPVRLGDRVTIEARIEDKDHSLVDPASQTVTLYDSSGTSKASSSSPTKTSTGVYTVDFDIPSDGAAGNWEVRWVALFTGGGQKSERVTVTVEES